MRTVVMPRRGLLLLAALLVLLGKPYARAAETPVNPNQIAVMLLVDYARSYGYQVMLARVQVDRDQAQFERDSALLKQKEQLYRSRRIPAVEIEIARLKDTWNRAQLVVSTKSLSFVRAEYEAMVQLAQHLGGGERLTAEALYATFRKGWEAGCEKGPDEVAATKARFDFMVKTVARAGQLRKQGLEPLSSVLDKQAQLEVARSEYDNRSGSLESCRRLLFPSLDDILAIKP